MNSQKGRKQAWHVLKILVDLSVDQPTPFSESLRVPKTNIQLEPYFDRCYEDRYTECG